MCGIAGLASRVLSDKELKGTVAKMCEKLSHRGPDNTSFFSDSVCSLGHTRLSLVDLSARSNQPFGNSEFVLVFNGEIYNYLELRQELIHSKGQQFSTSSDTEVLFYGLIHWGIDKTLKKIKGMFAFAFYTIFKGEIILARDRTGMKPLFYSDKSNQLIFASEIKAIASISGYQELNSKYISLATFGEFEYSRILTAFTGLKQLEPGTYLTYSIPRECSQVTTYFTMSDYVSEAKYSELDSMRSDDVHDLFEQLFIETTHSVMAADAKMGVFVSGGVDSSLCAALAFQKQRLTLFTSNVVGKFSEFENSTYLAKKLDASLLHHDFTPDMFLRDWAKTTWYYESPILSHSNSVPFQNVSRIARENSCKAVLTGEGSDELFLGYPRLLTRRFDRQILMPYNLITQIYKHIPGLDRYLNLQKENFQQNFSSFLTGFESQEKEEKNLLAFDFLSDPDEKTDHATTLNMLERTIHSLLWRNDRMGMMHSIESRFPFLYEDVLEFAVNLPVKYKIGKSLKFHNYKHPFLIDKYIVRRLTSKYLDRKLAYIKKQGFPMFGLMFISVEKEFFENGFWQYYLELTPNALSALKKNAPPYFLAKLASVEIWGSLFFMNQSIAEVDARIQQFIRIKS